MRHKIKGRKLNRTSSHRKALLINLASALLKHELIKTTLPKAKELRPFIEKLMTVAKNETLPNRRKLLSVLNDKELVNKLFSDIAPRIKDRKGGYTRIMHCGFRVGDKAPMAVIEFVDRKAEETSKQKVANETSADKKKNTPVKATKTEVKASPKKAAVKKTAAKTESASKENNTKK
jgi:large subunit ribosomal protein L17